MPSIRSTLNSSTLRFFSSVMCGALLSMLLIGPDTAHAKREKINRESGALNAEVARLLDDSISFFDNGMGRINLIGKDEKKRSCEANLYVSEKTTFITLQRKKRYFYDEFYIDHPQKSFSNILFQYKISSRQSTALFSDEKDRSFSIKREDNVLSISRRTNQDKTITCTAVIDDARYFEGESE